MVAEFSCNKTGWLQYALWGFFENLLFRYGYSLARTYHENQEICFWIKNSSVFWEDENEWDYGDVASIETTERYIELSINRYFLGKGMTLVNKLVYDLASEVLINSRITIKKYNCFKNAVKVDFMALVLTIIFLCVA